MISVMPVLVRHLTAHTMTIPARSLMRAVCVVATVAAVAASRAILIANTEGKAFCCRVGTGVFSGLV
jgi:hypothetical protein